MPDKRVNLRDFFGKLYGIDGFGFTVVRVLRHTLYGFFFVFFPIFSMALPVFAVKQFKRRGGFGSMVLQHQQPFADFLQRIQYGIRA